MLKTINRGSLFRLDGNLQKVEGVLLLETAGCTWPASPSLSEHLFPNDSSGFKSSSLSSSPHCFSSLTLLASVGPAPAHLLYLKFLLSACPTHPTPPPLQIQSSLCLVSHACIPSGPCSSPAPSLQVGCPALKGGGRHAGPTVANLPGCSARLLLHLPTFRR